MAVPADALLPRRPSLEVSRKKMSLSWDRRGDGDGGGGGQEGGGGVETEEDFFIGGAGGRRASRAARMSGGTGRGDRFWA